MQAKSSLDFPNRLFVPEKIKAAADFQDGRIHDSRRTVVQVLQSAVNLFEQIASQKEAF